MTATKISHPTCPFYNVTVTLIPKSDEAYNIPSPWTWKDFNSLAQKAQCKWCVWLSSDFIKMPGISAFLFWDILSWNRAIILWESQAATWRDHLQVPQPKAPAAVMIDSQLQPSAMWVSEPADDSSPRHQIPSRIQAVPTETMQNTNMQSMPHPSQITGLKSKISDYWCFKPSKFGVLHYLVEDD